MASGELQVGELGRLTGSEAHLVVSAQAHMYICTGTTFTMVTRFSVLNFVRIALMGFEGD